MSVINRLLDKLFGKVELRGLLLGLDASGRTTALYRIKLGEIVTTIPTIGFNVETVDYKGATISIWDVGGCDKIRPLWRHYFQNTQFLWFFVDCNDRERMKEAFEELGRFTCEDELRDTVIMVIANKQDLPNAARRDELIAVGNLNKVLHGKIWGLQECCATSGEGLFEALDWTMQAIQNRGIVPQIPTKVADTDKPKDPDPEPTLLEMWLEREDESDEDFLEKLSNYTLDSWDHYTHLRIAWLFMTQHGRRKGMKLIFEKIKAFIENSPRTHRSKGTTFHETMTYFWAHMVHYAISSTANPDNTFKTFLLLNPQLSNGGMFLAFYSKKLMLNTAASRTEVALPDIKPLPSILSPIAQSSEGTVTQLEATKGRGKEIDIDENFLERFDSNQLRSSGLDVDLRLMWVILNTMGRKAGIDAIIDRLSARDGEAHHFTRTYFWIQMVNFVMASLQKRGVTVASFEEAMGTALGKQYLHNPSTILNYFSLDVLSSEAAKLGFVMPDKKQLPNLV